MKRKKEKMLFFLLSMLFLSLPVAAIDDSGKWHNPEEIDWSYTINDPVSIQGSEKGWGNWNYGLQFTNPNHAMITFPTANLGFGMNKNGNFYWSKLNNQHLMILRNNAKLEITGALTTAQVTLGGREPCLASGKNCQGYCKGKSEGQEWNVDVACTYSCNCGKHGCSTCNGVKRTRVTCSPVGNGVYGIVPLEAQKECA